MTTTTFHFASAQEIDAEFINSVKKAFQARSISITVAEEIAEQDDDDDDDDDDFYLSPEQKAILDERLVEDKSNYISTDDLIAEINKLYGI